MYLDKKDFSKVKHGETRLEACIPLLEQYLVIKVDISHFSQSKVFIMGHTYFADGGF